jgi:hypothetical protein
LGRLCNDYSTLSSATRAGLTVTDTHYCNNKPARQTVNKAVNTVWGLHVPWGQSFDIARTALAYRLPLLEVSGFRAQSPTVRLASVDPVTE